MRMPFLIAALSIALSLTALGQSVAPPVRFEHQKLQPPGLSDSSGFGSAVSCSPMGCFVGASIFNQIQLPGVVYGYDYSSLGMIPTFTLVSPPPVAWDAFGAAIDSTNERLVVGDPFAIAGQIGSGGVYVHLPSGTSWGLEAALFPSDGANGDSFGARVAIDGERVLVGAAGVYVAGLGSTGAAYVFRQDASSWVEEQKLTSILSVLGSQYFGSSVAIEGDLAAVGNLQGSVHLFRRTGFTWALEQVVPPMPLLFGISAVEIEDGVLYIGYAADSDQGIAAGAVLQYELDGGSWVETGKILAAGGGPGRGFGQDLDLYGDMLIVGAWNADGVAPQTGVAHLFHRESGSWVEDAVLMGSDSQTGDLAFVVAIHGTTAILGAPFHDAMGESAGAAYVFHVGDADFRRGDANGDGNVDIADAIAILSALFIPGSPLGSCADSEDANDDGALDIADPVALLFSLFGGGGPLPPPNSICGVDPTPDTLPCLAYGACP